MEHKNNFFENREIFPSITTISSNWREKIEEVRKLGLKEVCLFLTCLDINERKELYGLLKKTKIERIPLVHLRSDMDSDELDYLRRNYQTEVFNTHTQRKHPFLHNLDKYRKIIYIENTSLPLNEEEVKNFAGVCLDISHLEISRISDRERYENDIEILEKYPCGCNHISAVKKIPVKKKNELKYDFHYLENLSDLDYLKRYPAKYFSSILAIELENPIEEQLKAKNYIIDLLKNK